MASQPVKSTKPVRSQDTLPSSDGLAGNSLLRFHGSDAAPSSDPPPAPIGAPRKQARTRSRLIPGVSITTTSPIVRGRHDPPHLRALVQLLQIQTQTECCHSCRYPAPMIHHRDTPPESACFRSKLPSCQDLAGESARHLMSPNTGIRSSQAHISQQAWLRLLC